jgi:hypothetical protein
MALPIFYPVVPAGNGTSTNVISSGTITAAGNSPIITPGNDAIVQITCSAMFNIRFGPAATLTAATAADIQIPANILYIVDLGHINSALSLFSTAGGTYSVNYVQRQ